MIVTWLSLTDFRNYSRVEVTLASGPNLFVGRNGQGKTNLVESIGFLSTLGSHRVSSDQALIKHGQESAVVRARLRHQDREVLIELQLNRSSPNRAQLNRGALKVRELPRHVSTVLFAPEDLALIRGEPAGRRRFLDELLVLRSPRLSGVISDYERVVRQRNSLLRSARAVGVGPGKLGTLEIWDERLIALGSELIAARSLLVEELQPHVAAAYVAVAGADHHAHLASRLSIVADPEIEGDQRVGLLPGTISQEDAALAFSSALSRLRRSELDRGITLVGPHRDDLFLELNDLPARGYASHGESWSFALSLKLAAAAVLRSESPLGDPVLILDDVFAELDESRRDRLAAAIEDFEQVLITAAVLGDVPPALAVRTNHIEAGRLVGDDGVKE